MSNETWQRVCNVLAIFSGIEPRAMAPGQCLGEAQTANHYDATAFLKPLGLDSLDLIEVTLKLQEEFGIEITDAECDSPALGHIAGLVAFVQGKLDSKPPPLRSVGDAAAYQLANGGGVPGFPLGKSGGAMRYSKAPPFGRLQSRDDMLRAAAHENGHRPDRNCSGCGRPY